MGKGWIYSTPLSQMVEYNLANILSADELYFKELETTIGLLHEINEVLVKIFEQQKQEFKLIY